MNNSLQKIVIVLTGTIVPNVIINSKHNDAYKRRNEYLDCIRFYTQFSKVYFLENSSYSLEEDSEFKDIPNLVIRKFLPSLFPERGKGFQEFEMLDKWIETEKDLVEKFVKITGRYLYPNFNSIWKECHQNTGRKILINQYLLAQAGVELFFTDTNFYRENFLGLYHYSDDMKGVNIDMCVYKKLNSLSKDKFARFYNNTKCIGIAGDSAKKMQNLFVDSLNSIIRKLNYIFDKQYIWISF